MFRLSMKCLIPALLAMVGLVGCSSEQAGSSFKVIQPETLEIDGDEWTKVEWGKKMDSKVARHFSRQPLLADNPLLSGEPVCYTDGSKERIYWLSTIEESCQWAMVEFKGSRGGDLVEGQGAPFLELATSEL